MATIVINLGGATHSVHVWFTIVAVWVAFITAASGGYLVYKSPKLLELWWMQYKLLATILLVLLALLFHGNTIAAIIDLMLLISVAVVSIHKPTRRDNARHTKGKHRRD